MRKGYNSCCGELGSQLAINEGIVERLQGREGPAATEDQDLIPLPVNLLAAAKEEMCGLNPSNECINVT